jgi:hypothetical protein
MVVALWFGGGSTRAASHGGRLLKLAFAVADFMIELGLVRHDCLQSGIVRRQPLAKDTVKDQDRRLPAICCTGMIDEMTSSTCSILFTALFSMSWTGSNGAHSGYHSRQAPNEK